MISGKTTLNISMPNFRLKCKEFTVMILILLVLFETLYKDFKKGDGYQHKKWNMKLQNEARVYTKYRGGLIGDCRDDCNVSLDNGCCRDLWMDRSILSMTPDVIMDQPPIKYLPQIHNPCFLVRSARYELEMRCFPKIFILGFCKAGTTDLHNRLTEHPLIMAGSSKEPHWSKIDYDANKYTAIFSSGTCLIKNVCSNKALPTGVKLKERQCAKWKTVIEEYSINYKKFTLLNICSRLSLIDSTPRLIWDSFNDMDKILQGKSTEDNTYLLPHKLNYLIPNAKLLIIMRNPVERLWSDLFCFTGAKEVDLFNFHNIILKSIKWWNKCVSKYKEIYCAFGYNFTDLPVPGFTTRYGTERGGPIWQDNAADRIRISIYSVFIEYWMQVIPKSNFCFINLEEYSKHPEDYLEQKVFPFLEVGKIADFVKIPKTRETVSNKNKVKAKFSMLNETRAVLVEFYRPFNQKLARLLNDDSYLWSERK